MSLNRQSVSAHSIRPKEIIYLFIFQTRYVGYYWAYWFLGIFDFQMGNVSMRYTF